jgi:hypothetical protein
VKRKVSWRRPRPELDCRAKGTKSSYHISNDKRGKQVCIFLKNKAIHLLLQEEKKKEKKNMRNSHRNCQWYIIKNRCTIRELPAVMGKIWAGLLKHVMIRALLYHMGLSVGVEGEEGMEAMTRDILL